MSYKDNAQKPYGINNSNGFPFDIDNNLLDDDYAYEMNRNTYFMYLWKLIDIAISSFQWTNLPEGIDERQLEFWLLKNGYCLFFKDDDLKYDSKNRAPEGYAVLQCMLKGDFDNYGYPRERTAYAVNGTNINLNEDNSIIIFNNYSRTPMYPMLDMYARRLTEIERSIDINVMGQKTTKVLPIDDRQVLTYQNAMDKMSHNIPLIKVSKGFDTKALEPIDLTTEFVADKLTTLKNTYWNEALTFLGIENIHTAKKERVITDEVLADMGAVEAARFTRLNPRQKACDEINERFGLDVQCEFRSGIYIRTDKDGKIATNGMESGSINDYSGAETGYSMEDEVNNIMQKIYAAQHGGSKLGGK